MLNGRLKEIKQLNLHVFPVVLESGSKLVRLPAGYVQPVLDAHEDITENKREYNLQAGEVICYYLLPRDTDIRKIDVYSRVEGGRVELEVYNWLQGTWEPLLAGVLQGEKLADYAGAQPLALKIAGSGRVIIPQISLEGFKEGRGEPEDGI